MLNIMLVTVLSQVRNWGSCDGLGRLSLFMSLHGSPTARNRGAFDRIRHSFMCEEAAAGREKPCLAADPE